jgi:hypothetical protein
MEVKFRKWGCLDSVGCVLSLGLLPLFLWLNRRGTPVRLTEEEMILSNGQRIPWNSFTSVKATQMYFKGTRSSKGSYTGTRFNMKHSGGKVNFATSRVENEREVVQFILSHVPRQVVNQ